jgi:hypothetical protein
MRLWMQKHRSWPSIEAKPGCGENSLLRKETEANLHAGENATFEPLWRYAIEQMAKLVGDCRIGAACEVNMRVSEFPRPRAHWKDYPILMLDSIVTSTRFAVSRNVAKVGTCPGSSDSYDIDGRRFYRENA